MKINNTFSMHFTLHIMTGGVQTYLVFSDVNDATFL